jgi:DNA-binding transcriptional ArsR family regulator
MFRIHLTPDDLAETRFAFSPIWELVLSVRALQDPGKHALHMPWIAETRRALAGNEPELLMALATPNGYMPDFISPPPETPFPEFDQELELLLATPRERVLGDMILYRERNGQIPTAAEPVIEDPDRGLSLIVEQMRGFWNNALAPHWPRIRSLLEGDVLHRARQLALGGAASLFGDLHPALSWDNGVVNIDKEHACSVHKEDQLVEGGGRGLVLIPAVFAWPAFVTMLDPPWQPTLSYSPRGVANLWGERPDDPVGAMDELIGETRASIMRTLEVPMTTSEVAQRLGVTAAAASQQLGLLRRAGVVEADRVGRGVYSRLTPLGRSLLELIG